MSHGFRMLALLRKLLASKDARVAIAALPLVRRWAGDQLATSEYRAVAGRLRAILHFLGLVASTLDGDYYASMFVHYRPVETPGTDS